ncbi:MAG TPA: DUF503 domain-containing protein [Microthrixaceae bacterium]|nr:DUF503 domain-containing protein [Microthrixaceae bacterium]
MHVLAMEVDIRLPQSQSLKDKRQVVRHLLEAARSRFGVSSSEVGHQDLRQRALLGFAVVASTAGLTEDVITSVEEFIWSHPELEVISVERTWLEAT